MLRTLLANEIARRSISVREAAKQIGLNSHVTLVHVLSGRGTKIENGILICRWLGIPLSTLVEDAGNSGSEKAIAIIQNILHSAPELELLFIRAADEVEKGNLTIEGFEDILEYAAFKISQGSTRNELTNHPEPSGDEDET